MKKLFTLLLAVFALHAFSQSQFTQTIRGTVIDLNTELPLPGAAVILLNSNPQIGTITNENGEFRLENVATGRQGIQVTFMGYNPAVLNSLTLTSGKELVLTLKLEEKVILTQEVVIKANARKDQAINEMATVSARSFSIEETERYAGSLGDPSRMAANFAGVSSATDQRNDIIIRGNSPLGLLWRLDDIDIPNPNHFGSMGSTGGPVSMLNNNVLSNSDFYTGAFPAEFGNAIAGAFDLKMRSGNNEKHEFLGQIGFNGFELGAEGPISKGSKASYLANFRYSTLEVMQNMGMDFGVGTAIPQYKDLTFKVDIPSTRFGKFSIFGIGGMSYIELLDSKNAGFGFGGNDIYYGADMGVSGFSHTYYFKDNSRLHTTLSVSGIKNYVTIDTLLRYNKAGIFRFVEETDYEIKYSISTKYSRKINSKNNVSVGFSYDFFNLNYNSKYYDASSQEWKATTDTKGSASQAHFFTEWQHKFSDNVTLNSGIHSLYLFLNNTYSVEPRLGIKWGFAKGQSLNLGLGMHSQTQLKIMYFTQFEVDEANHIWKQTNKDLDFTKSNHIVLGYDYLIGENLRMKLESYYQYITGVPVGAKQQEFSAFNQGDGFTFNAFEYMVNQGKGYNYGFEFTFEKFLNKGFYYLLTASIFESQYQAYDKIWRNSAFDNNYIFNTLAGYEFRFGERYMLAFDIKGVYAGGKRYLPIDPVKSTEKSRSEYDWTHAYENKYPDYFRVNGRITFKMNGKRFNQEWALDFQNITDHKNIFVESWDVANKKIKTDYQSSFMPMMTYRIQF